MNFFNIMDLNMFSFLVVIITYMLSISNNKHKNYAFVTLRSLLILVAINLVLETVSVGIQAYVIPGTAFILKMINFIYYMISMLLAPIITIFILQYINQTSKISKKDTLLLAIPTCLNLLLLLFNVSTRMDI